MTEAKSTKAKNTSNKHMDMIVSRYRFPMFDTSNNQVELEKKRHFGVNHGLSPFPLKLSCGCGGILNTAGVGEY